MADAKCVFLLLVLVLLGETSCAKTHERHPDFEATSVSCCELFSLFSEQKFRRQISEDIEAV